VNQKLCDIVGYTKDEMATLTFQDITHPDDLEADLKLMNRLLAAQIPSYAIDKRYVRKDGRLVWINLNVSLVRDDAGVPEHFIAVVKEINDRKQAEAALRKSRDDLELAVSATGVGMFDFYPQTGELYWSPELKRHYGLDPDAPSDFGKFVSGMHPADRQHVLDRLDKVTHDPSNNHFELEHRIIRFDDQQERWIQARGHVLFDNRGKPWRCIGTALDITEKKQAEGALRKSEHQLRLIFQANPIGMVKRSITGEIREANSAFLRLVGYREEDLLEGRLRWDRLTPPEYMDADREAMTQAARHGISDVIEKEYIRADGQRVPVLIAFAMVGSDHELVGFVLDISERKVAEERVRQAALHDPLTGLPNRALLFDFAKRTFARANRTHRHSAILYVDLDRFKPINDNYGHEVGDGVLREVAHRLTFCTRGGDMVFRLGGDEFLVLLPEIDSDSNAGDVARHMADCINRPYRVNGLELMVSASVGVSIYPRDGVDLETLVNNADAAMYQAKQAGRNNIHFYSQELAARSQFQSRIEEKLKVALAQGKFQLHYQPILDTRTARLTGVEALVRWPHANIGPDQFVPIAEATGHITRLGDWVIAEACRQHKQWMEHGLPAIPIAVNVSAVQLRTAGFVEEFARLAADCTSDMTALQVEVTETALMENLDRAVDVLARLQQLGVKVALDDFGTGYSSLNYLSQLPIDKIKVDKSFVHRIEHDTASRAITQAIIALARALDLEVVAEGIESESLLNYFREHGCNHAQGFYMCKPVSADAFETWYRKTRSTSLH
jgi:diguanylate cyclase (GGDEF)-like protein/PAS domain S-box-containing protein